MKNVEVYCSVHSVTMSLTMGFIKQNIQYSLGANIIHLLSNVQCTRKPLHHEFGHSSSLPFLNFLKVMHYIAIT